MDEQGRRLLNLRGRVVQHFDAGDWTEFGILSDTSSFITNHPRLLRSLNWGDDDYSGNVLMVLKSMVDWDPGVLDQLDGYLKDKYEDGTEEQEYISSKPASRVVTFAPSVFQLPDGGVEDDLVAVMMPFAAGFNPTYDAIKTACAQSGHRAQRADDLWEDSAILQDIFSLIFRANIVVVDFTGRNPNVMFECGIAHTLGKHVVPITQSLSDIPSDLLPHRALPYLPNSEGFAELASKLAKRFQTLGGGRLRVPFASGIPF